MASAVQNSSLVPAPHVAVVLNANAGSVTPRLAQQLAAVAGAEHVYLSRSLDEATEVAQKLVAQGYTDVVCGGGDGTLVNTIDGVRNALPNPGPLPRFGLLPLGTGNALRSVVQASNPVRDLQNMVEGTAAERAVDWIGDANGRHFFFAGVGHTAQVLHDYTQVRGALPRWLLPAQGAYAVAVLCRTIPRYLFSKHPRHVRIVTRAEAFYVDSRNADALVPKPAGTVLYDGPLGTLDVGTVPELGCRIRMFPFAERVPGTMQLRVSSMSLGQSLWNMPSIWQGGFRKPSQMLDFLVTDVEVELDKATTYQHSGDEQGKAQQLRFRVEPESLRILVQ